VKYIAQPYPLGASPFVVRQPGNCHYPFCKDKVFKDNDRDTAVNGIAFNENGARFMGAMHVAHFPMFANFYGDRVEDVYEDDLPNARNYAESVGMVSKSVAESLLLDKVVQTRPTSTEYVSNVEDIIKRLDNNEVLIIQRAGGTARRNRVHLWRKML
jgi:hypothetical protein